MSFELKTSFHEWISGMGYILLFLKICCFHKHFTNVCSIFHNGVKEFFFKNLIQYTYKKTFLNSENYSTQLSGHIRKLLITPSLQVKMTFFHLFLIQKIRLIIEHPQTCIQLKMIVHLKCKITNIYRITLCCEDLFSVQAIQKTLVSL